MPLCRLGSTDIELSALSLGSWYTYGNLVKDQNIVNDIVHTAFDSGINFFDMADSYERGNAEEMMGTALKSLPRKSLVLVWLMTVGYKARLLIKVLCSRHVSLRPWQMQWVALVHSLHYHG